MGRNQPSRNAPAVSGTVILLVCVVVALILGFVAWKLFVTPHAVMHKPLK